MRRTQAPSPAVELRDDLVLQQAVEHGGVAGVLGLMVGVDLAGQRPPVGAVVGLGPPAVQTDSCSPPLSTDFMPLVPDASSGGRGRLAQTSQPPTSRAALARS